MILLGISPSLLRIFKSTNPIESMIGGKNRERQRQALAQRRDHPALDRGGSGGGREAVPPRQRLPRPPAVARRAGEDAANRRCPDRHRGLTRPGPQETRLLQWALRRSYCGRDPSLRLTATESCQSRPPAVGRVASAALFATGWLPTSAAGPARRLSPLALLRAGAPCTG